MKSVEKTLCRPDREQKVMTHDVGKKRSTLLENQGHLQTHYKNYVHKLTHDTLTNSYYATLLCSLLGALGLGLLVEGLAGDGQAHHQSHELLKVHLAVSVLVQILHDLVHRLGVVLGLNSTEHTFIYN